MLYTLYLRITKEEKKERNNAHRYCNVYLLFIYIQMNEKMYIYMNLSELQTFLLFYFEQILL